MADERPVVIGQSAQPVTGTALGGRTSDGSWRPDTPFASASGLKLTMRRAENLTPSGVLVSPLRFQVPLMNEFGRAHRFNWSTLDTLSAGQRSRPMGAQLLELSMETMLMDRLAAEATSGLVVWGDAPSPQRVIDELRFIAGVDRDRRGKAAPFRLVVNQPAVWRNPLVDVVATLQAITVTQKPGHVGTEFIALSFLEYREGDTGRQRVHRKASRKHKLVTGDTLYKLARDLLHRASDWREIAKANGITGVSARDAGELAAWAKRHHKSTLTIPRVEFVLSGGTRVG